MSRIINTEKPLIVGLTGQTGAGKTTVSEIFMENEFYIINADIVARTVMSKGTPCINDVVQTFGNNILEENGELNRKKLANIVFSDKSQLEKLNSITYPYIVEQIQKMIDSALTFCSNKILIDAPTLFESGCNKLCNKIVSVVSNKDLRIKRIIVRDNLTKSQAEKRINSQLSEEFFRTHSDYIIENNTTKEDLQLKTLDVISKIKRYSCPCCNYKTFTEPISECLGDICGVCYWEIDFFIKDDNSPSSANHGLSLNQARENFKKFGACEKSLIDCVRKPFNYEL